MLARVLLFSSLWLATCGQSLAVINWSINNLTSIDGHQLQIVGQPKVIDTPYGKAVEFDGIDDGIIIDTLPIQGWQQFTAEIIFKPYAGGQHEQRFFHMQVKGEKHRLLFETRLTDDNQWYLDTFLRFDDANHPLLASEYQRPTEQWYHGAISVDGSNYRHYVNGHLQLSKPVSFTPLAAGKTALGMRLNKVWWYKGAILKIRLTPQVLNPDQFLALPTLLSPSS
ncbi:LamG domain-containing protein [Paraferrimonas sp. SM1919]|uniref:LamG domain-containing protein n=1 Tax=Paraferrimonas sp. SM1919 TaxID=2662263 RepID=UPI0013D7AEAF|nr:LamG domain-containing protein [Paraferrimonas sp. SM1919]